MNINEQLLIQVVEKFYPEKRYNKSLSLECLTKEAVDKYGNDRPDIREDKNDPNLLAFLWVVDFPMFEKNWRG